MGIETSKSILVKTMSFFYQKHSSENRGHEYTNFSDSNKLLSLNVLGAPTRLGAKYKILNQIGRKSVGFRQKNIFLKDINSTWKAWSYLFLRR